MGIDSSLGSFAAQKFCIISLIEGVALTNKEVNGLSDPSCNGLITTHPRLVLIADGKSAVCIMFVFDWITNG